MESGSARKPWHSAKSRRSYGAKHAVKRQREAAEAAEAVARYARRTQSRWSGLAAGEAGLSRAEMTEAEDEFFRELGVLLEEDDVARLQHGALLGGRMPAVMPIAQAMPHGSGAEDDPIDLDEL